MSGRHATYLREIFEPQKIVDAFVTHVPRDIISRNDIVYAGTGLSGTAALFILLQSGWIQNLAIVRKTMGGHSSNQVEMCGPYAPQETTWVFIDDFMASGSTFRKVASYLGESLCTGCLLYHDTARWRAGQALMDRYLPGPDVKL